MSYALLSSKTEATAQAAKTKAASAGLRIGEPNDLFEQEADKVAGEVMTGDRPQWSLSRMSVGVPLQRKCSCRGAGECEECKGKGGATLQRRAAGSATPSVAPPIVHEVLRSPGQPLDAETRAFFEPRFGEDFSRVRVHADDRAAESARTVNASAYTVGNDLVFADGNYAPASEMGRRLLAHELVHVVQQVWSPMLQRQPNDQASGGERVGPLVQKLLNGEASPQEKAALKKQLLDGQLSPAEVEALKNYLQEDFRASLTEALAPLGSKVGQIGVTIGGPVGNVHTFFKAKVRLRLSGAAKVVAGGLEGTIETVIEVNADKDKKTVAVTITPPTGDTSLAALIRAKAFPKGPISLQLGETFLKAINMISLQGELTVIFTGNKGAESGGLVIRSPDIPEGVELEATLSQSATSPQLAAATGSPALPSSRAFITGGAIALPKQAGAATTVGFDLPLFTDTKNPLVYGGLGLRASADTGGDLMGTGAFLTGIHLSPVTLQLAFEAGVGTGSKTSAVFGVEASVGVQVLKHVEVMALASAIGGKDLPAGGSLQAGAAFKF